ncbi:glycosyltransferase [Vibrio chagasii]|uniref:glycosyltransferase n=1 Tax=Vibrio chagasii TaxID=170679 RepID=UPI003DA19D0C
MNNKILFIALQYAHDNYLSNHKSELSKHANVESLTVDDKSKFISKIYRRRGFLSMPFELLYFFSYLIKEKPTHVLTVGPKLGLLLSLVCFFFPKIRHGHWFTGQVWGATKKYKRSVAYWCDVIITNLSNDIFSDGLSQREFLKDKIKIKKEIYTPKYGSVNGISDKFFSNDDTQLSASSDTLNVCYIGRKAKGKGLERIPSIARALEQRGIDVRFILAGPKDISFPDYEDWKEKNCSGIKSIQFIDDFVNPAEIFRQSQVLILPSDREGFGSVVIEAQACGLIVLCSDIYGLRDAFVDGVTGFSCQNNDITSYVDSIIKLTNYEVLNDMRFNALSFSLNFKSDNFKKDLFFCYKEAGYI